MSEPDRLEFIKEVLRSAPAGQFNALLEDIQTLSGAPLDPEALKDIQKRYESQTCSSAGSAEGESSHPLVESLRNEVDSHQNNVYGSVQGVTARREIAAKGGEANQILLRTYAERVDEEKCRTGSWTAEWTIVQQPQAGSAQVSGQVSICSFSFEDGGNIQLRSEKLFPVTMVEASDTELAPEIMKQISAWETKVLLSLQDTCSRAGQSLKSIRGILPLTHKKLNWNVVAQRTVRSLQETVSK